MRKRGAVSNYDKIWDAVRKIPRGRVATYGQIARVAGLDGHARLVGYALHALPASQKIPWHRVINASGKISLRGPSARRQQLLLEKERIPFNTAGRVDLRKYRWEE